MSLDNVNEFAWRVSEILESDGSLESLPSAFEGTRDALRPDQLPQARDILRRHMTLIGALEEVAAAVRRELDVVQMWANGPSEFTSRYWDSNL